MGRVTYWRVFYSGDLIASSFRHPKQDIHFLKAWNWYNEDRFKKEDDRHRQTPYPADHYYSPLQNVKERRVH